MKVSFSAQSNIGNVRSNNEDNLYCGGSMLTPETRDTVFTMSGEASAPCLFAVCDGMGGQEDGEFASWAAVNALPELEASLQAAPSDKIDGLVQEYVTKVNNLICDKMREKSVRIGTTQALVIIGGGAIRAYNIGDSRIYSLTGDALRQLSTDHTLTAQKVKMGVLTEEQARNDRDRHKLTRYLGIFEDEMVMEAEPLPSLSLTEPHRLLLCSDGLTDLVSDDKIKAIMINSAIGDAAGLLVKEALENGGKDNVTCVVIDVKPCAVPGNTVPGKFVKIFSGIAGRISGKQSKRRGNEQ